MNTKATKAEKMPQPQLEVTPLRAGVVRGETTELDVLVRVTAPAMQRRSERPTLNLALVLDRSGSMAGESLEAVKRAAEFAVRNLRDDDFVAVTIYDSEVETIVPSQQARDKNAILQRVRGVQCGGSTALHSGWVEGGIQASAHQNPARLNRVLLLTDGLANCGETDPQRIADDVKGLAKRGISTTAMGVGAHYNEDLLEAMARAGDGNYYFIEGASSLEKIFQTELHGLTATFGHTVSLGIETESGTRVGEVLSQLDRNSYGRLLLTNLLTEESIEVVLRLQIETPASARGDVKIAAFRLAYTSPQDGKRHVLRAELSLPAMSRKKWDALPPDQTVREQTAHKESLLLRQRALEELERGEHELASLTLGESLATFSRAAPAPDWMALEEESVDSLQRKIAARDDKMAAKEAKHGIYQRHRGHERRR